MKLACDIVSYIALAFVVIGLFCKNKDRVMFYTSIYNALIIATYFLLGQIAGSVMAIFALVRSFTYFIFAKKNMKPNLWVMILFEVVAVIAMILTWDSYISIILLVNLCMCTYTSWQDNMTILRIGFVISGFLVLAYDLIVGAYILAISETIFTTSAIISLVKNDIIPFMKKRKIKQQEIEE